MESMGFCLYETRSRTKKEVRPWPPLAVYVDGVDDLEFHFSRSRSKRFPKNGSYARKQSEWVRKSFPRSKSKKHFLYGIPSLCIFNGDSVFACLLVQEQASGFASGNQVRLWPPVTPSLGHYASSSLGDELDENAGRLGRLS